MISRSLPSLLLFVSLSIISPTAHSQTRDHLTPQEVDLVKDAQELDRRTEVFIRAVERRLMVISGTPLPNTKQSKKEAELWGDLPTGSRAELVGDIARIFDEAITNIDDVSTRDEKSPLIAKSLRRLAQAVNNTMTQLTPLRDKVTTDAEIGVFEQFDEDAKQILAAANKLPPEVEKKGKSKGEKTKN